MAVKGNYLVKKRNVLNELRANNLTLQELRFFSIYLSKIKVDDVNTRTVRFSISDFQAIMELGRVNADYLKNVTGSLLSKVVSVPTETGGYNQFQLFKKCKVDIDEKSEWYVEIDAHDEALPLMFEFKNRFFTYQLWNALRLKSSNQLRMYEILKQYEFIGERVLLIEDLRSLLGIAKDEYPRFDNFKIRVLDACQQSLAENTDLTFTYEPTGKKGRGGKILSLKFRISKNTTYVDQLTLDRFIKEQQTENKDEQEDENPVFTERINFLAEACSNEFSYDEIIVLYNLMAALLPSSIFHDSVKCYDYLLRKYNELKWRAGQTKIHKRFNYLKSLLELDKNNGTY